MNQKSKEYLATWVIEHMGLDKTEYEKRLWNFFKKLPTKILLEQLPEDKRRYFKHSVR